jgi:predicted nucleotide-binding protein
MLNHASFAVLVHTAEDEQTDHSLRARENVVHETGLFQGRLGFTRAIVLREEGCEPFSNESGITEIRFTKGNIRETFGELVATLFREFPRAS